MANIDALAHITQVVGELERELLSNGADTHECADLAAAIQISRIKAAAGMTEARSIIEPIVRSIYQARIPGKDVKPLYNMIEELTDGAKVFPSSIGTRLHAVRVIGNSSVHVLEMPQEDDLCFVLEIAAAVIRWYRLTYLPNLEHRPVV